MNIISTLNNPKHLVVLGQPAPKRISRRSLRDDHINMLHDRMQRTFKFPSGAFGFVAPLHNRSSFGDLDIVINKSHLKEGWQAKFSQVVLQSDFWAPVPGTDTTVFNYGSYQVNVHSYEGNVSQALSYLRNEGAAELVNIIANSIGLNYTVNGLSLNTGISEVPVMEIDTEIHYKLMLLGIRSDSWDYSLYNQIDTFKMVSTSMFFNREVFLRLESDTERLNKSPILKDFIGWLKINSVPSGGEIQFDPTAGASKKTFTDLLKNYSPKFLVSYEELIKRSKLNDIFEQKFNPEKVQGITGLTGELLIKFMNSFAEKHKDAKRFQMYIMTSLPETIASALMEHKQATIKPEEIEAQELADATALAVAVAQAALPPTPEPPKLVGKAKAKAKAVAKKAKEPSLTVAKSAKIAKTPKVVTKKVAAPAEPLPSLPSDNSFALAA